MLSVHIAINRVSSGIVASVYWFFLMDWCAVAQKHFGYDDLTYRKKQQQLSY